MIANQIKSEIGEDPTVDHQRSVYWVAGDTSGDYPSVDGFDNVPDPWIDPE